MFLFEAIVLSAFLTLTLAWWDDKSNEILLTHYGYDFDGWSEKDRYTNVARENIEKAERLISNSNGIGWPLKAILSYAFYLPYLLLFYFAIFLIDKRTKKGNS